MFICFSLLPQYFHYWVTWIDFKVHLGCYVFYSSMLAVQPYWKLKYNMRIQDACYWLQLFLYFCLKYLAQRLKACLVLFPLVLFIFLFRYFKTFLRNTSQLFAIIFIHCCTTYSSQSNRLLPILISWCSPQKNNLPDFLYFFKQCNIYVYNFPSFFQHNLSKIIQSISVKPQLLSDGTVFMNSKFQVLWTISDIFS